MIDDPNGEDDTPTPEASIEGSPVKLGFQFGVVSFQAEGSAAMVLVLLDRYLEWIDQKLSAATGAVAAALVNNMTKQ